MEVHLCVKVANFFTVWMIRFRFANVCSTWSPFHLPLKKHTSTSASTHSIYIDKWGQFWPPSLSNRVLILDWFLAKTGFGLSFPSMRWKNDRDQEQEQPAETDCGRGQLAAERIVGLSLPPRKIVRSNRAPHHPSKICFNVEQYFL